MSKVKVNNKPTDKKSVLVHYRKLWKSKKFRDTIKKKGLFVRASYNNKNIIKRNNIRIKDFKDIEKLVNEHSVELHTPAKNISRSYVDVDIPRKELKNKRRIGKQIIKKLKEKDIKITMVKDSPSGIHIHSKTPKNKLVKKLNEIEKEDKRFHIGKSSKKKITLDPYEPNTAVPGSLSTRGRRYKIWDDF